MTKIDIVSGFLGAGKTTLIKLANGLLVPSSGAVTIDGHTPGPETKGLISYLPERTYLSGWMNVVQLLDFFGDFYPDFDRDAAEHMLSALDVSPRLRIKQMSKGTREKVQLILVMSRRARLYLLDEPIGGVDPAARDYILNTILTNYSRDASVILSTHLIEDVEPVLREAISLNIPVMIECQIGSDDKVFPMVPAGKPIEEAFDEIDLRIE